MKLRIAIIIGMAGIVLGFTGCRSSRFACDRAEKLIAEAVNLCPQVITAQVDTDSMLLVVPGGHGEGERSYTQADMDSLLTVCNDLVRRAQIRSSANRREADALQQQLEHRDVVRIRRAACDFRPITVADTLIMLKVWTDGDSLRYFYNVLPQARMRYFTRTSTKVDMSRMPCPPAGVARWYRPAFWVLFVIVLIISGGAPRLIRAIR